MLLMSLLTIMPQSVVLAQKQMVSLDDAIRIAKINSYDAKLATFCFRSSYWTYRSYRAELLPAVNLIGDLMNFDHSRVETRNSENGRINYVNNNTLNNALTLSLDQQIASLGGVLSLQSYLYRLDQFNYKLTTYQSLPFRINYTQPLKTYNELKWRKKTEPKEYEKAKKVYLEAMEDVAIAVTKLFFDAIAAQNDYNQSVGKLSDLRTLYGICERRLKLGTASRDEALQLELSILNSQIEVNDNKIKYDDALYDLFSYLRVSDYSGAHLLLPQKVTDIMLSGKDVVCKALQNSSHSLAQDLIMLTAQQNLAKAKSEKGIQMKLNAEIGLSKTANGLTSVYSHFQDNEIVGVTLSLPIFDWGVKKGRVMMARSDLDLARAKREKSDSDFMQQVNHSVLLFGTQCEQCRISAKAEEISRERYEITKKKFEVGATSVTELNNAISELETAKEQNIEQLKTYWTYYYLLRRYTLYDWEKCHDLSADFENIVKQ